MVDYGSVPDWLAFGSVAGGYLFNGIVTAALYKLSGMFATRKQAATLQNQIEALESEHEARFKDVEKSLHHGGRTFGKLETDIRLMRQSLDHQPDGNELARDIEELRGAVKAVSMTCAGLEKLHERTITTLDRIETYLLNKA